MSISGADFLAAMGLDRNAGLVIAANDVTVTNSVLTGVGGADTRPFSTTNSPQNFDFSGNSVTGWDQGVYVVNGSDGLISGNVFDGNGNGVIAESMLVEITGNTFSNSIGAHVAPLPFVNVDIEDVVYGNTYLDQARPITVYLNGTTSEVTGSAGRRDHHRRICRRTGHHRWRRRQRLHHRQRGRRHARGRRGRRLCRRRRRERHVCAWFGSDLGCL